MLLMGVLYFCYFKETYFLTFNGHEERILRKECLRKLGDIII